MRLRTWSAALIAVALTATSCSENGILAPKTPPSVKLGVDALSTGSVVVISQVYGGGGNARSVYRNDFIELHNRGSEPVSLEGWAVEYASAAGAFGKSKTALTPLSGSIAPGQYLIVWEAAGTGGTTDLPKADFPAGSIAMSATSGKVALVSDSTVAVPCSGTPVTCASPVLVDLVGYGGANAFEGTAPTGALANETAAIRATGTEDTDGCNDTNNNGADFIVGAPIPRNSDSPRVVCDDIQPPGEVDHVTVTPETASITAGATQTFTAAAFDASNQAVPGATFSWKLEPAGTDVASIDAETGIATGLKPGDVSVVATANGKTATAALHVTPAAVLPQVRFSELHYDNAGDDNDEQLEIEGPAGTDLSGWSVILYDVGSSTTPAHVYDSRVLSGVIPASCGERGVVAIPFDQIQNGPSDGFALVHGSEVVEFLSYEGTMTAVDGPANGLTSKDIVAEEQSGSPALSSLQRDPLGTWTLERRSFGRCNADGPPDFDMTFSGRTRGDPPLPIGFEDQIFANMSAKSGEAVPTTVTWSSETPGIATIDDRGVMHAVSTGGAIFRATAPNGTSVTYKLFTTPLEFSPTAVYSGNTEFGVPHDADASDDRIIVHPQFTSSYNRNRNTPNWVSWVVESSHFGPSTVDRCDCFTHDPLLPSDFTHINTADYTNAGSFAGYGIDRGHLARSFDFTAASGDNAIVYLFSNIIPQAADVNQGQWADEENFLGNLARTGGKDIYTIAGVAGSKGTLKNEGKIVMPASVWKVSVIVPHGARLSDVHSYQDLEVISVIMPNDPRPAGTPKPDWHNFETTVDAVEALSGYDLLDALPDKIENAVESNTKPPFAVVDGPYTSTEGAAVSMSGAGSTDPNGSVVSYEWSFGDGATGTGATVSHTYAQDREYSVRLIATDNDGLADTTVTTARVTNVAPVIAPLGTAMLLPGETYNFSGSFSDPGADTWTATADYGDGTAISSVPVSGKTFTLAHVYNAAGTFQLTVRVADDDVTSSRTQFVTVTSQAQGLADAMGMVNDLAAVAGLNYGNKSSLLGKIDAARKQLALGSNTAAANQLASVLNELDALVRSNRMTDANAQALVTMINRLIRSISL